MKIIFEKRKANDRNDEYDDIFGTPTTQVWKSDDYISVLDDIIAYTENKEFNIRPYTEQNYIEESVNEKYNLPVDTIIATASFESAVKLLHKKHKTEVLRELKEIVIKLGNYEITTQKSNHPLKNLDGHLDIHIDGCKLVLLYRYIDERKLSISFTEESIKNILKLQDLVNHKELSNYNKKKLNSATKEFEIDRLDK